MFFLYPVDHKEEHLSVDQYLNDQIIQGASVVVGSFLLLFLTRFLIHQYLHNLPEGLPLQ